MIRELLARLILGNVEEEEMPDIPERRRSMTLVVPVRCSCGRVRKIRLLLGLSESLELMVFEHPVDAVSWVHGMDIGNLHEGALVEHVDPEDTDDDEEEG